MSRFALSPALVLLALCFGISLSGCGVGSLASPSSEPAGMLVKGKVIGGQQPVVGAHVYAFAANTNDYGSASTPLLDAGTTGFGDALGGYVLTDGGGSFQLPSVSYCTPNSQVYLYAVGGNPGLSSGGTNSGAGFLAVLGSCPAAGTFAESVPFVFMNELTTVAAAYAIAGYAVDATHVSSSGSAAATRGIANAFANAANLVDLSTGTALSTTPSGAAVVPAATINTLGNILAACVNSGTSEPGTMSSSCATLFAASTSDGTSTGTVPTDTATAAINIAHHPGFNTAALFGLQVATAPFAPVLANQPNDLSLGLVFSGGGLSNPNLVAIDSKGNAWITNFLYEVITGISSDGSFLSGATGFNTSFSNAGSMQESYGLAIDGLDQIWVSSLINGVGNFGHLLKMDSNGILLGDFTAGICNNGGPICGYGPQQIAVDAQNNIWGTNSTPNIAGQPNAIVNISQTGAVTSYAGYNPNSGAGTPFPQMMALDHQGNVWFAGNGETNEVGRLDPSGIASLNFPVTPGMDTSANVAPTGVVIDRGGNAWVARANFTGPSSIVEIDRNGSILSGPDGYESGSDIPGPLAVDGLNTIWYTNSGSHNALFQLSDSAEMLSPSTGYSGGLLSDSLGGIAVDASGNIWVTDFNNNDVVEFLGMAAPVATPIATATATNALGVRP